MPDLDKAKNKIINALTENNDLFSVVKDLSPSKHDAEALSEFFKLDEKEHYKTEKRLIAIDALALIGWFCSGIRIDKLLSISSEFDTEKAFISKTVNEMLRHADIPDNNIKKIICNLGISSNKIPFDDIESYYHLLRKLRLREWKEFFGDKIGVFNTINLEIPISGYIASVFIGIAVVEGIIPFPQNVSQKQKISSEPAPVSILLLLPANKLEKIDSSEEILPDTVLRLIDAAVYFGCFSSDEAAERENGFNLNEGKISPESAQYVYVNLKTDEGKDITGASSKFRIKKCLKQNPRRFIMSRPKLLDNLQGVDRLNRI